MFEDIRARVRRDRRRWLVAQALGVKRRRVVWVMESVDGDFFAVYWETERNHVWMSRVEADGTVEGEPILLGGRMAALAHMEDNSFPIQESR